MEIGFQICVRFRGECKRRCDIVLLYWILSSDRVAGVREATDRQNRHERSCHAVGSAVCKRETTRSFLFNYELQELKGQSETSIK